MMQAEWEEERSRLVAIAEACKRLIVAADYVVTVTSRRNEQELAVSCAIDARGLDREAWRKLREHDMRRPP